jgi:hypothetical protein
MATVNPLGKEEITKVVLVKPVGLLTRQLDRIPEEDVVPRQPDERSRQRYTRQDKLRTVVSIRKSQIPNLKSQILNPPIKNPPIKNLTS